MSSDMSLLAIQALEQATVLEQSERRIDWANSTV